jgi:hypothetical protein
MGERTKRTYNVSTGTIRQVRELAEEYGVANSQDAVVAIAVDRLYGDVTAAAEAERWAEAAADPAFHKEAAEIGRLYDEDDTWPR